MASAIACTVQPVAHKAPIRSASNATRRARVPVQRVAQKRVCLARVARRGGSVSQRASQRVYAEETTNQSPTEAVEEGDDKAAGEMYAQIFGSNLQMAVWVSTLSLAGFTAYKEFQAGNSEAVGMLVAPPAAALVLIVVFLTYWTISTNAKKERRAAKKAQREAQGPL
eukprot:CAMPEP_0198198644 /NCGR_PEP_ID=MMETSP1445-20131203/2097_1 /TAXON_ID=36898 /ORGANISM="Pyramimonas sp., Strain CCMP2087" /LENGTH=167 /DNA_ID=CAMNT_0043868273 /DNA_START=48 /DNA_END=551 /DNA_ORIENTATION=+